MSGASLNKPKKRWYRLDLRDETDPYKFFFKTESQTRKALQGQDALPCAGHPFFVAGFVVLSLCVLGWGFLAWRRYVEGVVTHLQELWFQTTAAFVLLTILGLILPARIRFGWNLYGILGGLLLLQYGLFLFKFPLCLPTGEDLDLFRKAIEREKRSRSLGSNDRAGN